MACAFLAEPTQAKRLATIALHTPEPRATFWKGYRCCDPCSVEEAEANPTRSDLWIPQEWHIVDTKPELERQIIKGSGQYVATIGFIDLLITFFNNIRITGWKYNIDDRTTKNYGSDYWEKTRSNSVLVEVKINEVPTGDVLRQLKMYRDYFTIQCCGTKPVLVLATTYPINTVDAAVLAREGIKHVRLGAGFEAWCNTKREVHASPEL